MLRSALGVVLILTFITGCSGPDTPAPAAPPPSAAPMASPSAMIDTSMPYASPAALDAYASPLPGGVAAVGRFGAAGGPGRHCHSHGNDGRVRPPKPWRPRKPSPPRTSCSGCRCCSTARTSRRVRSTASTAATTAARVAAFARARNVAPDAVPAALASDAEPDAHHVHDHRRGRRGPVRADPRGHDGEGHARDARLHVGRSRRSAEKFHASPTLLQRLNPGKRLRPRGRDDPGAERAHEPRPRARRRRSWSTSPTRSVIALDAQGNRDRPLPGHDGLASTTRCPSATGRSTASARIPTFNYNPDLFWDAEGRALEGEARARARTTPSAWSGSTCRRSTTASTARPSRRTVGKTRVPRLHPPHQLGRAGAGGHGAPGHPGGAAALSAFGRDEGRRRLRGGVRGRRGRWRYAMLGRARSAAVRRRATVAAAVPPGRRRRAGARRRGSRRAGRVGRRPRPRPGLPRAGELAPGLRRRRSPATARTT